MSVARGLKRVLLGRTMASGELRHTLLPKILALPVFSSDPLSSNAYATQEIMLVLGTAGALAMTNLIPIAFAVAILLATVVISYRQTVRAYPSGGGAYTVARENLGAPAGLLAGAALLIDYVMTVAVSATAGIDAIISVSPDLADIGVQLTVLAIFIVMMANLRGTKESGTVFAIPTYGFVVAIYIMLITGFVKCVGGCPIAASADLPLDPTMAGVSAFLILRAFAAGTTALTGVEAISNGVPAFRYPQSKNAATTLGIMGAISISMFIGITWLTDHTGVVVTHDSHQTVLAQVADTVFGGGVMFYFVQAMTAGILILAANTANQDFPRLASILAQDRYMPRQFMSRGDRLVFSNGVVILAVLASTLVIIFKAELNALIQLYLIGVFISFTLSQSGMVVHWLKERGAGWRTRIAINGFGATVTGIVFVIVVTTKFKEGGWIVVIAIPTLIMLMRSIHKHYTDVANQLAHPERRPVDRRPGEHHMVIFVDKVDSASSRAIGYVRGARPRDVSAITLQPSHVAPWKRLAPEIPMTVIEKRGSLADSVKTFLRAKRAEILPDDFLTLVIPEMLLSRGLLEIIMRPRIHRLKASFLGEPGVQIMNIPVLHSDIDHATDPLQEPARNTAVVLVSGVHNGTLQAIEYAETLRAHKVHAVSFGLDPDAAGQLGEQWLREQIPVPLELHEAPFRELGTTILSYVRSFKADGTNRVLTVIIPEFIVGKQRHQILHGQTSLLLKRHLLFERGVVVASVPYHLTTSVRATLRPGKSRR